jgi:hypothetical protein
MDGFIRLLWREAERRRDNQRMAGAQRRHPPRRYGDERSRMPAPLSCSAAGASRAPATRTTQWSLAPIRRVRAARAPAERLVSPATGPAKLLPTKGVLAGAVPLKDRAVGCRVQTLVGRALMCKSYCHYHRRERRYPTPLPKSHRGVMPSENPRNQPIAHALCIIPIPRQFIL